MYQIRNSIFILLLIGEQVLFGLAERKEKVRALMGSDVEHTTPAPEEKSPATKPAGEKMLERAENKVTEPKPESAPEPVAEPKSEPVSSPAPEPAPESTPKPASESAPKVAAVKPAEPVATTKPVEETVPIVAPNANPSGLPAAPKPEQAAPEDLPVEVNGIDTVDMKEPEGNWLFKRIWWQESKNLYGKIRERVDKIAEARMHFYKERVRLDREVLSPFYAQIGLDQEALQESVNNYQRLLERDQDRDGALTPAAQATLDTLLEQRAAIGQLDNSIQSVRQTSAKLDEAFNALVGQIQLARSYESDAWQRLDDIAEELNDKKAQENYYVIATLWRNVKDIGAYIQGPFAEYFIKLAQSTVQDVNTIRQIADMLDQKELSLKNTVELTLQSDADRAAAEREAALAREEEEEEAYVPKQKVGWGEWLLEQISAPFTWLASLFGL